MKERGIIFGAPMVRAILDGEMTQTRRIVRGKTQLLLKIDGWEGPFDSTWILKVRDWGNIVITCQYGKIGDRLWVRESWRPIERASDGVDGIEYKADDHFEPIENSAPAVSQWISARRSDEQWPNNKPARWRPSIHMPRWASRIDLEVTNIRLQRLQEISEMDAYAEGIDTEGEDYLEAERYQLGGSPIRGGSPAVCAFAALFDRINPGAWDANPFVWVVEFKRG